MSALQHAAQRLMPDCVSVHARDPRQPYPLLGSEAEAMARAVPSRQREFSAGRDAARACLRDLGAPLAPLPVKPDRAPAWPDGYTGSITHSRTACLGAAVRRSDLRGLGIDVEPDEALPEALMETVLRPDEADLTQEARRVFSVKEAVYKAISSELDRILEFRDLRLERGSAGTFRAHLTARAGPWRAGAAFTAVTTSCAGHILSACWLTQEHTPC